MNTDSSETSGGQTGRLRILVLRGGSIGDFLLTLPALTAIRREWPKAYIELAGYPHIAQLACAGKLVDKVISLETADVARFFSLKPQIDERQKAYVCSFDLIITYLYDPDQTVRRNMLEIGANHVIYGSPKPLTGHAIDNLMKALEQLAIYPESKEHSRLVLAEEHIKNGRQRAKAVGERVVAVHPGSGSPAKNWPLAKFLELAELLATSGRTTPIFTLGEADREISVQLKKLGCLTTVLPQCSLVELAEFLSACDAYVGNDSGITHLAASLGIPVVAIFGPTDPEMWAPRGPNTRIIRSADQSTDGLSSISVDDVMDALHS
jgi:heptosyltransferase III